MVYPFNTHMKIEIPNLTAFDEAALGEAFAALEQQARAAAATLNDEAAVEAFKLQWLGRKQGLLKEVSDRWQKSAPAEAKKLVGMRFNALKPSLKSCSTPRWERDRPMQRSRPRLSTLRCPVRGGSPAPSIRLRAH